MEKSPPPAVGLLGSLRVLSDILLGTLQDRLELFSVELQEEKFRLIQTFIWISAAVCAGMLAITFASLTLVYVFWDSGRLAVLGGLAAFFSLTLVATMVGFRRFIARQPIPFAASRQELGADRACIRKSN